MGVGADMDIGDEVKISKTWQKRYSGYDRNYWEHLGVGEDMDNGVGVKVCKAY